MNGFKSAIINRSVSQSILKNIVSKVLICCDMMQKDCLAQKNTLKNLEEDIRDYLFNNYLNSDDVMEQIGLGEFRFFSEVPENYRNSKPIGRTDLQVINMNMFKYRKKYFTIECKRVDGTKKLNRYYIENGVKRFVLPEPLYPSYYRVNCMFAFVVKNIDVATNAQKISDLQTEDYKEVKVKTPFLSSLISSKHTYTYESEYFSSDDSDILLFHIFYDFWPIIGS